MPDAGQPAEKHSQLIAGLTFAERDSNLFRHRGRWMHKSRMAGPGCCLGLNELNIVLTDHRNQRTVACLLDIG